MAIFPAVRATPNRRGFLLDRPSSAGERLSLASRRLPGLPERLSPRARCVLLSRCTRERGPSRSSGSGTSVGQPRARRPHDRRTCLPRSPQSASRRAVLLGPSAADRPAGQPRRRARLGDLARPALSTRLAEEGRSREGHRRSARGRLRHDGSPSRLRCGHPVLQRHGSRAGAGSSTRAAVRCSSVMRPCGLGCSRRAAPIPLRPRRSHPPSPPVGSRLPRRGRSDRLHAFPVTARGSGVCAAVSRRLPVASRL